MIIACWLETWPRSAAARRHETDSLQSTFVNGDSRHLFSAGDVLFVPAGVPHRFEDFTDGFGTSVIYDPEGVQRLR